MQRKFLLLPLLLSLTIACTHGTFPVVRPVQDALPDDIAKIKAQDYFVRARDYERRGLPQTAERYYEMAYELDSVSKILQEQLTRMYLMNGKYAHALLTVKKNRSNNELTKEEKRSVATIYLKMGELNKAVDLLEDNSDKTEEDIYTLGLIYESMGNVSKALENYTQYFSRNPDVVQIGFKIGKLLLNDRRYKEAEILFQGMRSGDTTSAEIFTQLGLVKVMQGDTVNAIALYDSAISIDSTYEEALRNKAQIFIGKNSFGDAIQCYELLYKNSSFGEVYGRTLALLYYYNEQYAESEKLLKSLLEQSIDDYELHYYLGLVFSAAKKFDLARIELEKTLSIRVEFDDAWRELCYVALKEKKYDEALKVVERYTSISPEYAPAWRLKGYICALQKSYPPAIEALQKAIALDTTDIHSWFELGSAFERNGEIEKAADAFGVVLRHQPNDPATLNYLGYMWAEKGMNLDSARGMIKRALEQDQFNGAYLDSYAWVFYQTGEIDSAEIYIKKALARIDNDPVIHMHLGDILVKKNDFIGAVEAYRKALEFNPDDPGMIRSKIVEVELLIHRTESR